MMTPLGFSDGSQVIDILKSEENMLTTDPETAENIEPNTTIYPLQFVPSQVTICMALYHPAHSQPLII